ncbi:hypothetical protein BTO18_14115 [Polaribacter porphyrae]|uniref:Uncharacterized protein n=2 Tax=Polaribacter porphyrae TaxID=1137780 RepID=A0A2S7WSE4_9FLAO|nr:hypothetical protein BTO18_14115 [Polaribacter porphyrae]
MSKISYEISQNNNELILLKEGKKTPLLTSFWYMEFGKTCAEIKEDNDKLLYSVTKKFQFWKWKMVYLIFKNGGEKSILISQNTRNTVFKIELLNSVYQIKVNYKKKKSIYKDTTKIAEFDESFLATNNIKLLVADSGELQILFLLYTSLFIGINDLKSKTALKSQKQLEKNTEAWF